MASRLRPSGRWTTTPAHRSAGGRRAGVGPYTENFADYQQEAQQRWGETDAWAESRRRTKDYTRADWEKMRDEEKAVNDRILEAMDAEPFRDRFAVEIPHGD